MKFKGTVTHDKSLKSLKSVVKKGKVAAAGQEQKVGIRVVGKVSIKCENKENRLNNNNSSRHQAENKIVNQNSDKKSTFQTVSNYKKKITNQQASTKKVFPKDDRYIVNSSRKKQPPNIEAMKTVLATSRTMSRKNSQTSFISRKNSQAMLPKPKQQTVTPLIAYKIHKKQLSIRMFSIKEQVNDSEYSKSFRAFHIATGFVCSLRVIRKQKVIQGNLIQQVISSIRIHSRLEHPNISRAYGFFCDEVNLYIIEEAMLNVGLEFNGRRKLSEKESGGILRTLSLAIQHCHDEGIIHRDIKLKYLCNNYGLIKISDFSWAATLRKTKQRETFCGSIQNAPPQLIEGVPYNESVDVWILGVILYEMTTGLQPFSSQNLESIKFNNLNFPLFMSNEIVDLLGKMLSSKDKRISVGDILEHQWVAQWETDGFISKEIWNFWLH